MYQRQIKLTLALCILFATSLLAHENHVQNPDPIRFKKSIDHFIEWDKKNSFPENAILFVGSSSIRMWKSSNTFPGLPIINRGFGGSHISDVIYYYNDIVFKYKPKIIVFYAGDNDVAGNKPFQQVYNDFVEFRKLVKEDFPKTKIIFIPIKPSMSRWNFWPIMKETNQAIEEYIKMDENLYYCDTATPMLRTDGKPIDSLFLSDKLHMTKEGYSVWVSVLDPILRNLCNQPNK